MRINWTCLIGGVVLGAVLMTLFPNVVPSLRATVGV